MRLTPAEVTYLAAWAREEWEPDCYQRPAHRLELSHGLRGAHLIDLIKAWTGAEGKKDQDILTAADDANPDWPWSSAEECSARLQQSRAALARAPARG
jgi:hypothetical protein